jgi:hypothetical protein
VVAASLAAWQQRGVSTAVGIAGSGGSGQRGGGVGGQLVSSAMEAGMATTAAATAVMPPRGISFSYFQKAVVLRSTSLHHKAKSKHHGRINLLDGRTVEGEGEGRREKGEGRGRA